MFMIDTTFDNTTAGSDNASYGFSPFSDASASSKQSPVFDGGQPFRFLPATDEDVDVMLERIGLPSLDSLFTGIPETLRYKGALPIPPPADEWNLTREMKAMAVENTSAEEVPCFLGGGIYDHFIPSAVHHLVSRSEFWTAYTPYQPEMSQGMLQAIFEYQSLISGLTGMNGTNASLYDGATAMFEGALLAARATNRNRLLVSRGINPEYRRVLADSLKHSDMALEDIPMDPVTGRVDPDELEKLLATPAAAILIQSPNFFGIPENVADMAVLAHRNGAQCNVSVDPVSLGLLKSPGEQGADIATGEGQPLGIPMSFGGPGLGLFAVKSHLIRQMPGRLVGETRDQEGRRGFVLTLQAREQHIRRERAASNICTNQALCALTATVHLSLLGSSGLKQVARQCLDNAVYLQQRLVSAGIAKPVFVAPFFREFAIWPILPPSEMNRVLHDAGIIGGLDLSACCPDLKDASGNGAWLIAVTEKRTRDEMDRFCEVLLTDARMADVLAVARETETMTGMVMQDNAGKPVPEIGRKTGGGTI
jgi:glycine dehydrogenase subunit 1